eukprot:1157353-Pelagomonas_calceolata.AAC.1
MHFLHTTLPKVFLQPRTAALPLSRLDCGEAVAAWVKGAEAAAGAKAGASVDASALGNSRCLRAPCSTRTSSSKDMSFLHVGVQHHPGHKHQVHLICCHSFLPSPPMSQSLLETLAVLIGYDLTLTHRKGGGHTDTHARACAHTHTPALAVHSWQVVAMSFVGGPGQWPSPPSRTEQKWHALDHCLQVGGRGGRGGRGVGRGGSRAQGQQDVQHPAQQQLVQQHPYEQQQQQQQQQHALPPYDQPHASPVFPAPAPPAQQPQYSQPLSCQQLEQQYLQQHQYQHHHQHHQHFQPYPAAPYPQPHLHEHLQQPGAQYAAAPTDNAAAPSAHGANPPSVGNSAGGGGCVEADGSVVGSGREGAHAGAEGGGRGGRGRGRGTGEGGGRGRGMRDGEGGRGGRGGGKGGGRGQKGGGTSNAGMEVHAPLAHDGGPAPTGETGVAVASSQAC